MSQVEVPVTFAAPELAADDRLNVVLRSALKAKTAVERSGSSGGIYWSAAHFGLDRVSFFADAGEEDRQSILKSASRGTLEEAYWIEKSGMSFTAKMALLSRTTQERMLYSLFSADETVHLHHVQSYIDHTPELPEGNPFISLLSEIIREGERETLVLLIQVVLEGWGIAHYHDLAESCQDPGLRESLRMIVKDEARHHGSGMLLSKDAQFNRAQRDYLREVLVRFLSMVQCGPVSLVSGMERDLGHFSFQQKARAFEELKGFEDAQRKLALIRGLLEHGGAGELVEELDRLGSFRALSAEESARVISEGDRS